MPPLASTLAAAHFPSSATVRSVCSRNHAGASGPPTLRSGSQLRHRRGRVDVDRSQPTATAQLTGEADVVDRARG